MKKAVNAKRAILAAGFLAGSLGAAGGAVASPIFLDLGFNGDFVDADSQTDLFDFLTFDNFAPTSTYFDITGPAGINTGDVVVDTGSTTLTGLNGLQGAGSDEGLPGTWNLNIGWTLFGVAGVVDTNFNGIFDEGTTDVLGAQFTGGLVTFTLDQTCGICTPAPLDGQVVLEVVPTGSLTLVGSDLSLTLQGFVQSAAPGFAFFEGGDDFADVIAGASDPTMGISVTANTDIFSGDLGDASPATQDQLDLLNSFLPGPDVTDANVFQRTTTITSIDVGFEVPAPATLALLGLGLLGLGFRAKRQEAS